MKTNKFSKRIVALAYLSMFFEGGSIIMLSATKELLAEYFGVDITTVSLLITVRSITCVIALLISGRLSDKYGRKPMILIGIVLIIAYHVFLIPQGSFTGAIILTVIFGIGYSFLDPSAQALLFDSFEDATPLMPFIQITFASGSFLVPLIVSRVIKLGIDWTKLYYIYALLLLGLFVYAYFQKYPSMAHENNDKSKVLTKSEYTKEPRIFVEGTTVLLFVVFAAVTSSTITTWADVYVQDVFAFNIEDAVRVLSFYQAGCIIGAITMVFILRKVHVTKMLVICQTLACLSFFIGYFSGIQNVFIAMLFTTGIFAGTLFSMSIGLAGKLFWKSTGFATALVCAASSLSFAGSVAITGKIINTMGVRSVFTVLCGTLLIASTLSIIIRFQYKAITK